MPSLKILQGGMGVAVSNWTLARTVAQLGQIGVVSGTGLAIVVARRLQLGDPGGHVRRAMSRFPVPGVAERMLQRYFVEGGKADATPFKLTSVPRMDSAAPFLELTVLANFVEVFLAKEGHHGLVGINFMEKLQVPTVPSLFGAMLAGVDLVLMGAGIPRHIPGILDALARGEPAELALNVEDAPAGEQFGCRFDPAAFCGGKAPALRRPGFIAIISSATLAMTLARKSNGRVDGFVVEGPTAGGHNAPPRGQLQLNVRGEPVYGERDDPDLGKIRDLGLPFWMAGGFSTPAMLARALHAGATGIQVGTAFAFCRESGLAPDLKQRGLALSRGGRTDVFTDRMASPTGFPFKVLNLEGTLSDAAAYESRARICDLGYLTHLYKRSDGSIGYRCPAEPVEDYVQKGGQLADTVGRKCLCNTLFANIGQEQLRADGTHELPLVTAGDDAANIARFLKPGEDSYSAADVVESLLAPLLDGATDPPRPDLAGVAGVR
jgi:NAD(P)H-dependent flavin oxidoreductase YrpB (nitropropane dioxygenase family)